MALQYAGHEMVAAGFWRRSLAFVVDTLVLGAVGAFIGWVLYNWLISVGPSALLIGFAVSLVYFGVMDSHLGQGRTLGKRLLRVCVVDGGGHFLSVSRAMLRFTVLGVPYFLARWVMPPHTPGWVLALHSLGTVGIGLSLAYLYIFNYRTRQSLHDVITRAYVISTDPDEDAVPAVPLWRGHLVIIALICMYTFGAPYLVQGNIRPLVSAMRPFFQQVQAAPHVMSASINVNKVSNSDQSTVRYVTAQVRLDNSSIEDPELAYRVAQLLTYRNTYIVEGDRVAVKLTCGFDIGIASWWVSDTYRYTADEGPKS
ncbi:RDD family protein [Dyella acidiphila]|uniref:RDD family protein n=1 Tax=Dyella acidiphila TaxID=2775866 RepID=A0ABR9G791_9GAMM|nr:RDD family protein [Dyella acidiphila]MBE1159918.1 RDD family protein [Dyella acidiphila]